MMSKMIANKILRVEKYMSEYFENNVNEYEMMIEIIESLENKNAPCYVDKVAKYFPKKAEIMQKLLEYVLSKCSEDNFTDEELHKAGELVRKVLKTKHWLVRLCSRK